MEYSQGKLFEVQEVRGNKRHEKFFRLPCKQCGAKRWVRVDCLKLPRFTGLCVNCSRSRLRKGGRTIKADGYINIKLRPDDFFYPMADKKGYVREHRLVMAKYLHRCLLPWEVVHHKNGNRDDNRLENLELLPASKRHLPSTRVQRMIRQLEREVENQGKRITLLEAENVALRKALIDGHLIELHINY